MCSKFTVEKRYATLKSHFSLGLLLQFCCLFAEHISEKKPWETASERNSFVQVNCKFCLHKNEQT